MTLKIKFFSLIFIIFSFFIAFIIYIYIYIYINNKTIIEQNNKIQLKKEKIKKINYNEHIEEKQIEKKENIYQFSIDSIKNKNIFDFLKFENLNLKMEQTIYNQHLLNNIKKIDNLLTKDLKNMKDDFKEEYERQKQDVQLKIANKMKSLILMENNNIRNYLYFAKPNKKENWLLIYKKEEYENQKKKINLSKIYLNSKKVKDWNIYYFLSNNKKFYISIDKRMHSIIKNIWWYNWTYKYIEHDNNNIITDIFVNDEQSIPIYNISFYIHYKKLEFILTLNNFDLFYKDFENIWKEISHILRKNLKIISKNFNNKINLNNSFQNYSKKEKYDYIDAFYKQYLYPLKDIPSL